MGVRHRLPPKAAGDGDAPRVHASDASAIQASDALPLPIRHTNIFFSVLFMAALYFLMCRWREKVRASSPLHLLTLSEILAFVCLVASLIYLISFFGISYVQSSILSHDDIEEKVNVVESSQPPLPLHRFPPTAAMSIPPPSPCPLLAEISDAKILSVCPNDEDENIVQSVLSGEIPSYILESKLGDCRRAAGVRREAVRRMTGRAMEGLPLDGFDYQSILGQCCEMPVGFVTLPVGIAGPLVLDGLSYYLPMATTEGCLVASTNRGCKAIALSGGAQSVVLRDAMSRAPVVRFATAQRAAHLKSFLEDSVNFDTLATVFNRSSRFARLQGIHCALAGRNVYVRFSCSTGDAMGMNMVSKGVQNVLDYLHSDFPDIDIISISGNFCSDKKPAAVNWIEGRGKSVVCEATIKEEVVLKILKTTVPALVELNTIKNLAGSAVAGALGGFNAHASNIVTAIYIATGQDPAQNVESSHCITMMEAVNGGKDLHISVTMPSIEVGTVGGGTQLAAQAACLDLLGVKGPNLESPGANSRRLATIIAGAVLGGELSLMSALASGQLVNSHMKYNRSSRDIPKAVAA
ncbi:Hydroxymethylglutaryl-CoA reductase eukaryotic/archaeal type protein [Dioscorea alata]|uniref:Hydroxymethylglutaryl-CoA reductase eukaryotic/archaeal type protein n=1 Tax=Dioscorea alata TaxID=55571 RepID=A0ACB7UJ44_DIOAL|nr:Hydroxymethylglutaryl-CoA reductase eukaryotic/archaeal type protein [Dioscorea alata]